MPSAQQAGLRRDRHPHFVGDFQARAAEPLPLGDENPQIVAKLLLFRGRQPGVIGNIPRKNLKPVARKPLGQQSLPATVLEPIEHKRPKTNGCGGSICSS